MVIPGPGARAPHFESTFSVERRLRRELPYINISDLVQLRQLLPEYLQMTHRHRGSALPEVGFTFRSNVLSSTSNHPVEDRVGTLRRLREALTAVSHHELDILRQLVPQYLPTSSGENENENPEEPRRFPRPVPPPTRCHSRSRSPEVLNRSFMARCSVRCSFSGCCLPCGKPIFALGPASHIRHLCQEHRVP
jgi:hypothetical protein